jgi:2-polyprenyl-3-methyl-5-hydroxy-6-metoxy-1,4-benzoquinol methylase
VGGPGRPSLARLQGGLAYHQTLLGDARRNRAFHRALAARVRPGASVLDLGAGTGVWAVVAARLGAARVVAVEREAVLVPVISALARENGVADRVEVLRADARRVRLPRAFDVVVSEMVGNEAFEEGLVPILARARTFFLRPGGALVPEWVALTAAPVAPPLALGLAPPFLRAASVASLTAHVPRNLHPTELVALAPGRELLRVDLGAARADEPLPIARARFHVRDGRSVGGIAVWVVMGLAPGVRLATRGGTHWLPTLLPLEALPAGGGRLDVEIDWNPARRRWSWRFEGEGGARAQAAHSPLFAWGVVRPAVRAVRAHR